MNFNDDRDRLLDKLSKLPELKELLQDKLGEERLVQEENAERAVLPYGGPPAHKGDTWRTRGHAE